MKKITVKIKPLGKTDGTYTNENQPDDIKAAMSRNSFSANNIGIRDGLNALGFDNNSIGWDGENVTYNDKPAFVPDRNDNGTAKINTAGFVKGVNNLYGDSGNYLADVTAYAANSGISNFVEYGNEGVVSIGGVPVRNVVIIDGQAYASTNDIKNAISTATSYSGISSPVDIYEKNYGENGRYSASIDKLINKLVNREEFRYNPEEDPAYLAYRDMYMRNGAEARDDTYGTLAARTGGYGNSAAMAAAGNAYASYIGALNDKVPELYKDAYERYRQSLDDDIKLLSQFGTPKDIYGYQTAANSDMRKDISDAMKADYNRNTDLKTYSSQRDDEMFDREDRIFEREYKNAVLEQSKKESELQNALDWDKSAINWDKNAIDRDKNAIEWDKNAISWDKNAISWDKNAIDRGRYMIGSGVNRSGGADSHAGSQTQMILMEIKKLREEINSLKQG